MNDAATIRRYRPGDRKRVRFIFGQTAMFGKPIEGLFSDLETLADLMLEPYLRLLPHWAWVLETQGTVCGYLLGCPDPRFQRRSAAIRARAVFKLLARTCGGRYSRSERAFLRRSLKAALAPRPAPPASAHAHVNLLPAVRAQDLGMAMLGEFERTLLARGGRAYYIRVFSSDSRRRPGVYARFGFETTSRLPTDLFEPELSGTYEMVLIKHLT